MDEFESPQTAADVVRGVMRLFLRQGLAALAEVPLPNNRRADVMALGPKGDLTIAEVKVSRADLLGDGKWTDYLDYCDRYFWAVPLGFDMRLFDRDGLHPDRTGVIIADRYDAVIAREAPTVRIPPARRRAETVRFARRAAFRLLGVNDDRPESGF